jgi:hypothetical protein
MAGCNLNFCKSINLANGKKMENIQTSHRRELAINNSFAKHLMMLLFCPIYT